MHFYITYSFIIYEFCYIKFIHKSLVNFKSSALYFILFSLLKILFTLTKKMQSYDKLFKENKLILALILIKERLKKN